MRFCTYATIRIMTRFRKASLHKTCYKCYKEEYLAPTRVGHPFLNPIVPVENASQEQSRAHITCLRTLPTSFVEEICPACTEIHDLRTPIPILLKPSAFGTVIRIRNACHAHNELRYILESKGDVPAKPQMMHLPPKVPKLQSSQMRTIVSGRTYESQTGLSISRISIR